MHVYKTSISDIPPKKDFRKQRAFGFHVVKVFDTAGKDGQKTFHISWKTCILGNWMLLQFIKTWATWFILRMAERCCKLILIYIDISKPMYIFKKNFMIHNLSTVQFRHTSCFGWWQLQDAIQFCNVRVLSRFTVELSQALLKCI